MKKVNQYFLGEDATRHDIIWFYGPYALIATILVATFGGIQ